MTIRLDPAAALVLIDVQQGIDDPRNGRRNNPGAERNIARLLAAWRASGRPLVHVQHHSVEPHSALRPELPGVAFKPEAMPLPGETVIAKSVNCAFLGTGLEEILRERGVRQVVVAGLTTDHCVSSTARLAADLGFDVIVAGDACATHDRVAFDGTPLPAETMHAAALASLQDEFAQVVTTEGLTGL